MQKGGGSSSAALCLRLLQAGPFRGGLSTFPPHPRRYIAALLLSLGAMLHLELPHVNVLSKVDLLRHYGRLGGRAAPLVLAGRCVFACERGRGPPASAATKQACHIPGASQAHTTPSIPLDFPLDFYTEVQDLSYPASPHPPTP